MLILVVVTLVFVLALCLVLTLLITNGAVTVVATTRSTICSKHLQILRTLQFGYVPEIGTSEDFASSSYKKMVCARQNLLEELEKQYKHRMFWLTTEDSYKQFMAGQIFKTPREVTYSLVS